jgi:sugar lactone lactonase YvrE
MRGKRRGHGELEVVRAGEDELGEGPVWDAERGRLLRVDITAGRVLSLDVDANEQETLQFDGPVGFALPRRGGGLVVGVGRRVVLVDESGERRVLASVEPDRHENRFNDAACDARGRLWAGTMSLVREHGVAALHRIEPDGSTEVAWPGATISNGLDWSPDGRRLFYNDSLTLRVDVLDFDLETGTLANRRPFASVEPRDGLPDGLVVDVEGGVWIALFGGGQVRRLAPDGQLDLVVELPVSNPTSLAFGGPQRTDLFITTAKHRLDAEQHQEELALLLGVKPVQRDRVVTGHQVRVQGDRLPDGRDAAQRLGRHRQAVAHAAAGHDHVVGAADGDLAGDEGDHEAAATRAARGARLRWQIATASASAA